VWFRTDCADDDMTLPPVSFSRDEHVTRKVSNRIFAGP
jgi:hypothetical protein